MSWLERIFGDKTILAVLAFSGVIGFVGGIANGIIQKKHGTWGDFFACIFIGLIVSVIIGLGIKDHVSSEAFRFAIIGVSAVISQDIWAGFRAVGRLVSEDPLGAMARLIAALRGQNLPPSPAPPPSANAASPATPARPMPMPPPDSLG